MKEKRQAIDLGAAECAVLRKRQVCQLLGISPATLDRRRVEGDFPPPIKLGEQAVGWRISSIHAWLESRPVAHHFTASLEV